MTTTKTTEASPADTASGAVDTPVAEAVVKEQKVEQRRELAQRDDVRAWRGRCTECDDELDAFAAKFSRDFGGPWCDACIDVSDLSAHTWESKFDLW